LAGRRGFGGMDIWNLNLSVTRLCRLKVSGPWEEIIFAKGIKIGGGGGVPEALRVSIFIIFLRHAPYK